MLDHDFLIGLNLAKKAVVRVMDTTWGVHHKQPATIDLELELLEGARKTCRTPPRCELLGLLECGEDLARTEMEQSLRIDR